MFSQSEEKRIQILSDNAKYVDITDIELSTEKKLRQKVINNANATIISYHNFEKTPPKQQLEQIIQDAQKIGDIPKIAVKPESIEDTYIIIELLIKYPGIIAISMDKLGTYTRVISPILKAPVTYASIKKSSAPGQLDIKSTQEILEKIQ